jgi:hypothetical protein
MVDNTPIKPQLTGLNDYTAGSIITTVNDISSQCNHTFTIEKNNIRKFETDSGTEYSTKTQENNLTTEMIWYSMEQLHTLCNTFCPGS